MKQKKKMILFCILCFLSFVITANAECDYETQVQLNTEASNVKINYEIRREIINMNTGEVAPEATDADVDFESEYAYQNNIYISLLNLTENIYVELIGNNGSVRTIRYSDTENGSLELNGGTGDEIITYTVNIKSNNSNCTGDLLKTFEFITPKRNRFSGLLACKDVKEYYCEPYVTYDINMTEGEIIDRAMAAKEEEEKQQEEEENKNWWTEWLEKNPWFIPTVIGAVVVAGVTTTVIIIKKRRKKVL